MKYTWNVQLPHLKFLLKIVNFAENFAENFSPALLIIMWNLEASVIFSPLSDYKKLIEKYRRKYFSLKVSSPICGKFHR